MSTFENKKKVIILLYFCNVFHKLRFEFKKLKITCVFPNKYKSYNALLSKKGINLCYIKLWT